MSWWDLLASCKRRGVDLLYSNMESLLPLPHTQLITSASKPPQTLSILQDCPPVTPVVPPSPSWQPCDATLRPTAEWTESSDDGSPVKVSSVLRKSKRRRRLSGQGGLDSDSEDDFVPLHKHQTFSGSKEDSGEGAVCPPVKRKPLTPEERLKSLPVSQCLHSLGAFFDDLSCMDSSVGALPKVRDFTAGASVKDGMTDEARAETDGGSWRSGERSIEIAAAVEALSFRKCWSAAAAAWDEAKRCEGLLGEEAEAELTLPVAVHRDGYSYAQEGPCHPQ